MQQNLVTHGHFDDLPPKKYLRAGNLKMVYEAGFIRYVQYGEVEVLRMINHLLRDANWDTIPMYISNEKIEIDEKAFTIDYEMHCKKEPIDFFWKCRIVGDSDSSIVFKIEGEAKSNFQKNRAGFTVMHPIESCKGKLCKITHSSGKTTISEFPKYIAAKQPFLDIRGMEWEPSPNMKVELFFEGDIFETEDQRNWTDASYKTYCTPLAEPFPKTLKKGDSVAQTVTFRCRADGKTGSGNTQKNHFLLDGTKAFEMPKVGTVLNTLSHNDETVSRLEQLNLDFLRVELKVWEWDAEYLEKAIKTAKNTNCSLEVVLFFDDVEIDFIDELVPHTSIISRFILFTLNTKSTHADSIEKVVPLLRKKFPKCQIGAGTDAFFKELNDYRVPVEKIDFLTFSVNPQVHAFDLDSLTETLQAQRDVVETCKHFSDGKEVAVGPVSLHMRWNPNATTIDDKSNGPPSFTQQSDSRQVSLYGASWLMGSFKNLTESGANTITFFQTSGRHGLMANVNDPWTPEYKVPTSCVYPMYLILKEILKDKSTKRIIPIKSSNNLVFDGLVFLDDLNISTLLVSNYTNEAISIQLPEKKCIQLNWMLDTSNILDFTKSPEKLENALTTKKEDMIILPAFGIGCYKLIAV